jgi:hypothetical protein
MYPRWERGVQGSRRSSLLSDEVDGHQPQGLRRHLERRARDPAPSWSATKSLSSSRSPQSRPPALQQPTQRASTVGRKSLVPWPVLASEGDPTGLNPVAILGGSESCHERRVELIQTRRQCGGDRELSFAAPEAMGCPRDLPARVLSSASSPYGSRTRRRHESMIFGVPSALPSPVGTTLTPPGWANRP